MHHALGNATQQLVLDLANKPTDITQLASYHQIRFLLLRKIKKPQLEIRLELESEEIVQTRIDA